MKSLKILGATVTLVCVIGFLQLAGEPALGHKGQSTAGELGPGDLDSAANAVAIEM